MVRWFKERIRLIPRMCDVGEVAARSDGRASDASSCSTGAMEELAEKDARHLGEYPQLGAAAGR